MAAASGDRQDTTIIKEIYEHDWAQEEFELELDQALEAGRSTIIIEPSRLGEQTAQWIYLGNLLHKTAVLSGLGCLVVGSAKPNYDFVYLGLGMTSVLCAGVYGVSWQFDPCCKYQVEKNLVNLRHVPMHNLGTTTPVVLVRKDDTRRKFLHNTIAVASLAFCAYRVYQRYFS